MDWNKSDIEKFQDWAKKEGRGGYVYGFKRDASEHEKALKRLGKKISKEVIESKLPGGVKFEDLVVDVESSSEDQVTYLKLFTKEDFAGSDIDAINARTPFFTYRLNELPHDVWNYVKKDC